MKALMFGLCLAVLCSCGVGADEQRPPEAPGATAANVTAIFPYGPEYHYVCPKDGSVSSSCVEATAKSTCNTACAAAPGKGPSVCARLAPTMTAQCAP